MPTNGRRPITKDIPGNTTLTLCFSPDYLASAIDFDTLRKSGWIADSLVERPIAGVTIVAPPLLTHAQIEAVHAPAFVRAVERGTPRDLAASAGLGWDAGLWTSVRASNGGIVHAARLALATGANTGSLSAGLHHARRDTGSGFCTFNGLALAARAAIDAGASRVVILDLDAHCGGGTASIVSGWPEVTHIDVAVSAVDHYRPSEGQMLEVVWSGGDYLPAVERALERAPAHCDLVLYNAGMDPHEDSAIGGPPEITTDVLARRERMVFDWARSRGIPVAFVLAGGYSGWRLPRQALVNLHRLTVAAGAGCLDEAPEDARVDNSVAEPAITLPTDIPRFQYDDGGRAEAGRGGTTDDCVTRAIAIATEFSYQEVQDTLDRMAKYGPRAGRRRSAAGLDVSRVAYEALLAALGWEWTQTMQVGSGRRVHLRAEELPTGSLIVRVSGHLTAVMNGTIRDTHDPSCNGTRCVYGYYRKVRW